MHVTEFLQQRIYGGNPHPSLAHLSKLEGRQIGDTSIDSTLEDSHRRLKPWMPLFVLPIGEAGGFHIGVHLRPSDVKSRRFAILQMQSAEAMMEMSGSLEHLIYWTVAFQEGAARGRPRPNFEKDVATAAGIFSAGFYEPGRHGRFSNHEAQQVTAGVHGGSAEYYYAGYLLEDEPDAQLDWLKQGITAEPECLAFYVRASRLHEERGERLQAATMLARALNCYHHTSYEGSLKEDYDRGRRLVKEFPGEFSDVNRRDLEIADDKTRFVWVTELYEGGQVELATKVLCDMSHEIGDYDSVMKIFRKHFERLSWDWGLALCDFREGRV